MEKTKETTVCTETATGMTITHMIAMARLRTRCCASVPDDVEYSVGPAHIHEDLTRADEEYHRRDDLGHPRDGPAPLRSGKTENGRDQSPRVANADKKDKVG